VPTAKSSSVMVITKATKSWIANLQDPLKLLFSGSPVSGISLAEGDSLSYAILVPNAGALTVTLSGGVGNADLYISRGRAPARVQELSIEVGTCR